MDEKEWIDRIIWLMDEFWQTMRNGLMSLMDSYE